MLDELGTRQERLTIGLPVWFAAVAMAYTGVPWLVVAPLGVVSLVLIAGSIGSAKGATLAQLAVAAPLLGGHVAIAFPQDVPRLASLTMSETAPAPALPPLPQEVAEAAQTPFAACAYWGAREAVSIYCPSCRTTASEIAQRQELARIADHRKCERIFSQTFELWRAARVDCQALSQQQPRLASEIKDFHNLCLMWRNPRS